MKKHQNTSLGLHVIPKQKLIIIFLITSSKQFKYTNQ